MKDSVQLLVLAGGFGTRLRSVVAEVPKPLAPVAGQPYLHYLLERWVRDGVTSFVFLLHHQAGLIEAFLQQEQRTGILRGCSVDTVIEQEPMGTGGAVAHAVRQQKLSGSFLVANADTWLGSAIGSLAPVGPPALGVVHVEDASRYGRVRLEGNRVSAFEEKRADAGAGWINAGLYHLEPGLFEGWDGRPFSLEREILPRLAAANALRAVPLETDFIDIGVPEDYHRFCRWIESGQTASL